ncbi:hypothetical protein LSCM1_04798 [Leishmania martiniquensis]|uniref:Uncharacterized protein n=1 Tax=Leishmania martiniquensis TaxID=1580590 RepID=A0A836HMJ4_9TRYP|nr:hypothetical protein LSCM1_04798 [Leishmania martiniquensis]
MTTLPPAPGEELVAVASKRFAIDFSSDGEGTAAPHPSNRPRLGSSSDIELSGLFDESSDRHDGSLQRTSPPRLASTNDEGVPRLSSSAHLAGGVLKGAPADMASKQRGLQLRRFSIVDSSASDQSGVSYASHGLLSSAASTSRRRRGGVSKHRHPKTSLIRVPAVSLAAEASLQSLSSSARDAVTPSPEVLDGMEAAGDSSGLRQPPQSRRRVAPAAPRCADHLGPSAVVMAEPDFQPAVAAPQPLPITEARKHSDRRHGAAAARRVSTERTEECGPAWATAEVQKPPSQRRSKDGERENPSSPKDDTAAHPRRCPMKEREGARALRVRVTNPTSLYDRAIQGLMKASAKREAMRAKLEEDMLAEATFHPTISPRGKALKRSGDGVAAARDSAAQLHYRLQLLELPDGAADEAHSYIPRLSRTSEMIVRARRERGGAELPPEERLYRDYFYRQQAMEEIQMAASQPAVVRRKRDIEAHVAELYSFEEQRQRAITAVREAHQSAFAEARQCLYVDPRALVERLTTKRSSSQRRTATTQLERDECRFRPQTSASAAVLSHQARLRGLHRWVRYFCGSDLLSTDVLSTFRGQASHEAATLSALLWRYNPTKTEWSVEELADALAAESMGNLFAAELWCRRPPVGEAPTPSSELTFRPRLNPKSATIVDKMEAQHRRGPIYDRLFLSARVKQLSQRQQELEEEQASIETKHREQQRRQRVQGVWRAQEAGRLEAYRAVKAKEHDNSAAAEVAAAQGRPRPFTPTCSHQLLVAASSSLLRCGRRGSEPPSLSPRQPTVTADATVTFPSRPPSPSVPATPSASPPEVTRARGSSTGVTLAATKGVKGGSGSHFSCPSPLSHPAKSSGQDAPGKQCLGNEIPQSLNDLPVTVKHELERAAEELHDLLVSPTRPSEAAQKASNASSQCSVPGATRGAPSEVNHLRDRRGKLCCGSLDLVLACAQLRDPQVLPSAERERLDKAQKRQLRELGRLLYNRHISRIKSTRST